MKTISDYEMYKIMIENDVDGTIDRIIEKNNQLTRQDVKIEELEKEIERLNNIINEVREYIKNNTLWFDDELGLVEMEGYQTNRIPVVKTYYIDEILDKGEE